MLIKRRIFIQTGSLATATLMVPRFLKAFEKRTMVPPGNKVMVVLQLSGGNDGLNTVIPVSNDLYYKLRPSLSIKKDLAFRLTDDISLHPALKSFKSLYDEGALGIMNNVGYPNPDRSHFRSMDIWQSASDSNKYINDGWIGRYLDAQCAGCDVPTQAIEVDDTLSLALKGKTSKALAVKDPRRLLNPANENFFRQISNAHQPGSGDQTVDYLYKTMADTLSSAGYILKQSRLHPTSALYPKTEIGNSLKNIASLIFSDINTKVYYLSLGSFDTHVGQPNQQNKLFTEMNGSIEAFVADLKTNNRFQDVMIVSFSEFGRRVTQNASNGTDHGTANNVFFISGGLKQPGLLNAMPDLSDLQDGDLKHSVDFRNVYATLLKKWLGADDQAILGRQFQQFNFI
jgi:uncharacterized protein (DUF1501 family)